MKTDDNPSCLCAPLTIRAAPNIALVKYWGKSDANLNIPLNTSVSITLDRNDLFTEMEVSCNGREDTVLKINGENISPLPERVRRMMRACAEYDKTGLEIKSFNSFPISCGLASSSSGMAALAFGVAWFSGCGKTGKNDEEQISLLARLGSGSACRSIYGGFVEWTSEQPSIPRQIKPHTHWPELHIVILIFDNSAKLVGSSEGMRRSIETSKFLKQRISELNSDDSPVRLIKQAVEKKDFNQFAEIVMKESNSLHAVCMDTYPPLLYLNDASRAFIGFVHEVNKHSQVQNESTTFAYSFDAGPNAFCFADKPEALLGLLRLIRNFAAVQKSPMLKKTDLLIEEWCAQNGVDKKDDEIEEIKPTKAMHHEQMRLTNNFVHTFVQQLKDIIITKPGPAPLVCLGSSPI